MAKKITHGAWLRAGAYYFTYKTAKSTEGVQANVDIPLQSHGAHLLFMDSFDSRRHNLFSVGIRFDVGDTGENRDGILSRMTDPLRRNLASVQAGAAVPVRLGYKATGPGVITENVFFFAPGGGAVPFAGLTNHNVCTAENPCTFTQEAVDDAEAANANGNHYFFAKGTYSTGGNVIIFNGTAQTEGSSQVWGFDSTSFNHQATGNDRPLINGALFWGNLGVGATSSGTVRNMRINASNTPIGQAQSGHEDDVDSTIALGATGSITVSNSSVTAFDNDDNINEGDRRYAIGIFAHDNLTVNNSNIDVRSVNRTANGIQNDLGDITVNSALITTSAGFKSDGIDSERGGTMTVSNTSVSVNARGYGYGLDSASGTISLSNSNVSTTSENRAFGVHIDRPDLIGGNIQVENSSITAIGQGNAFGVAIGYQDDPTDINVRIDNTTIRVISTNEYGYGIHSLQSTENSQITVNNSLINVFAVGESYAIKLEEDGNITVNNSTISSFGDDVFGIEVEGVSLNNRIEINQSTFSVNAQDDAYGIKNDGGNISISNSVINSSGPDAFGIESDNQGNITVANSTFNSTGPDEAKGIRADDANVNVSNSHFNVSSIRNAAAIQADNSDVIQVLNSTLHVEGIGRAQGIDTNSTDVLLRNSTIDITSTRQSATGIDVEGGDGKGNITIEGSTIRVAGFSDAEGIELDLGEPSNYSVTFSGSSSTIITNQSGFDGNSTAVDAANIVNNNGSLCDGTECPTT